MQSFYPSHVLILGSELPREIGAVWRRRHVLLQLPMLHPRPQCRRLQPYLQQHRIPLLRASLPTPHGIQGNKHLMHLTAFKLATSKTSFYLE